MRDRPEIVPPFGNERLCTKFAATVLKGCEGSSSRWCSMHRDELAVWSSAVPKKFPILQVCLMLLLSAGMLCTSAMAAHRKGDKAATAVAAQPAPADFVGGETCATCHEEIGKKFAQNPHSRLAELHGGAGVTCEGCHGPGKAHVDDPGDVTKIFNPAKATTKEVDDKCLGCHQGQHANFERSGHGEGSVSCLGCHSIHTSTTPEHLLNAVQPQLCLQCHTDVRPQFNMPFHHKVEEGLLRCSDCHDPHGTFRAKGLKASAQQDAV